MNPFHSFGVSTILFVLTLFFLSPSPTFSEQPDPLQEKEKLANAMSLARKEFVTHINAAAKTGDLSEIHYHAQKSLRFGKDLLSHAQGILDVIGEVVRSLNPQEEERKDGEKAIFHLKEAIKHGKTALMHAHHATHSKTLRSGLSHAREGAKHARISGLYALEGENLALIM